MWGTIGSWVGKALGIGFTGYLGYSEIKEGRFPVEALTMAMVGGFASASKSRLTKLTGLTKRVPRLGNAPGGRIVRGPTTKELVEAKALSKGLHHASNVIFALPIAGAGMALGAGAIETVMTRRPAEELMQTQQFILPQAAYTMRQRALQAIHMSQTSTRAAFGDEASYMHS